MLKVRGLLSILLMCGALLSTIYHVQCLSQRTYLHSTCSMILWHQSDTEAEPVRKSGGNLPFEWSWSDQFCSWRLLCVGHWQHWLQQPHCPTKMLDPTATLTPGEQRDTRLAISEWRKKMRWTKRYSHIFLHDMTCPLLYTGDPVPFTLRPVMM